MALTALDSICKLISSGGTPSRKNPFYFANEMPGHPWVKSKELLDCVIARTEESISDEGLSNSSAKYYPAHAVLVAMYGANVGQLGWLRSPATVNQAICALVVDEDKADWRYVFYALLMNRSDLTIQAQGAAQQNLNQDLIRQFCLDLPPLPIQRRIANILSAYDDLIENSKRRIKILEEMARRLYREWFVYFRFPGHEGCRSVESQLGEIPEGWEVTRLGDVTSKIGSGATPKGGKGAYKSEGIHLIRSLNIYDYSFEFNNLAFIDEVQAAGLDNVEVKAEDVLLNITGASVARCAMVPSYLLPARVNQHVAIVRADKSKASSFYLLDAINSDFHKQQLLALAQGGATREALTKDTISAFQIVLPPATLMNRYRGIAGDIHLQREVLLRQVQNLRLTRDLLLPRLLSGLVDIEALPNPDLSEP
jgi:type I restriction enzyme S subunit